MIKRYKKWKNWRKYNTNGRFYQFLVLIGLAHSPTFEVWYYDVGSYVAKGFANSISYDEGIDIFEKMWDDVGQNNGVKRPLVYRDYYSNRVIYF